MTRPPSSILTPPLAPRWFTDQNVSTFFQTLPKLAWTPNEHSDVTQVRMSSCCVYSWQLVFALFIVLSWCVCSIFFDNAGIPPAGYHLRGHSGSRMAVLLPLRMVD